MQILIFVTRSVYIVCRDYYMLLDLNLIDKCKCYVCSYWEFLNWLLKRFCQQTYECQVLISVDCYDDIHSSIVCHLCQTVLMIVGVVSSALY